MINIIAQALAKFAYKFKFIILGIFVVLLVLVCFGQSQSKMSYTYVEGNKINEIFTPTEQLVLVYDNNDEKHINKLIDYLGQDKHVIEIQSYANTLNKSYNYKDMASYIGLDSDSVKLFYYLYFNSEDTRAMSIKDFINFLTTFLDNKTYASMFSENDKQMLLQYSSIINAMSENKPLDAESMGQTLSFDSSIVSQLYAVEGVDSMTISNFVNVIMTKYSAFLTEEQSSQITGFATLNNLVISNTELSAENLSKLFESSFSLDASTIDLIYSFYYASTTNLDDKTISLYDFFMFINKSVTTNKAFLSFIDEDIINSLDTYKQTIIDGKNQLVGKTHSRMILKIDYEPESSEIKNFYSSLHSKLDSEFSGDYYLVGNSAMAEELSQSFSTEYLLISILIAVLIFIIICITFKNAFIPLILVVLIETAVFSTMSFMSITHVDMYFIAMIIVQSMLMGSMVDYGILMSTYYLEERKDKNKFEALKASLKKALPTIATSALIMIACTFILGAAISGAVSSILFTLGIGITSASILIVFVLPALLVVFDKFVFRHKLKKSNN